MIGPYNVPGTLTPKHVHLLLAVFFEFHLEERWRTDKCKTTGMISQELLKIEVKLLLTANKKSYMPRQQRMTLSDLE